jgi:HK97 family phage major capsid protein
MTILELREARNKAWEGAKAFVESKRDKEGLLSKEDAETYNSMEEKIKNYSKEIERMEAMENMENELNKPVNSPIVTRPLKVDNEVEKTGRASNEYKNAMLNALRSNFRQVSNVLQEGVDADGGYLVPDEYDTRLIQKLEENNVVRMLSTNIKTSGEHKINIASTTPAAAWIEEGGALTFGDATFEQKILDAHKLHVAVKVTEELLYDNAFGLENFLIDSFGKAIGNAEENAFLNGTGTGQPTGIFTSTGGGTYITAKSKDADAIIELVYSLKRAYRKNAAFIMNDKMIATIRTYKDSNGAYMWQPSLIQGEPDRLLGYPVYTSEYAPEDSIAFGDFSYYNIGDRGVRSFKQLTELFAGNGMIGYVAKERVDGKLVLPEAVQILKITTTTTSSATTTTTTK